MILNWRATKFLGNNSAHLLDEESSNTLIQSMVSKFGINMDVGFKTPSFKYFKMIKEGDFDMLRKYPHVVTVNYGIHPLWCLWLTTINGIHYNLYVNLVTKQIIWSRHRFSPKLYNDTILEGEMIGDNFIIWDLMVHKGVSIMTSHNHAKRQDIIRTILDHQYVPDPVIENVKLINREYVAYQHIKSYLKKMTDTPPIVGLKPKILSFIPVGKSVKIYNLVLSGRSTIERLDTILEYPIDYQPMTIKTGKMVHPPSNSIITPSRPQEPNNSSLLSASSPSFVPAHRPPPGFEAIAEVSPELSSPVMSSPLYNYRTFWLSKVEGYVDNYWQYVEDDVDPNSLVKVGLIITPTKESSLKVSNTFENAPVTHIKSGIRGLLKWKCRYIPRFQKWEPVELATQ